MRLHIVIALIATTSLTISHAHAQDIFRLPDILVLPTGDDFKGPDGPNGFRQGYLPEAKDNAGYIYLPDAGGCYLPSDPNGTYQGFRGDNFYDANGSIRGLLSAFSQLAPDGDGVEAAFVPSQLDTPQSNFERVRIFRYDCTMLHSDGQGGAGGVRVGGDIRHHDDPLFEATFDAHFVKRGPDTFCFATRSGFDSTVPSGIVCIDQSGPTPSASLLMSTTELDALLAPSDVRWYAGRPPPNTAWTLSSLMAVPDGRLFFFADYTYLYPSPTAPLSATLRFVVERAADGTLKNRYGPVVSGSGSGAYTPLAGAGKLIYDPDLDALLAWPVINHEFDVANYNAGGFGWSGYGLRVLPLDQPGSGYVPLSLPLSPLLGRCIDASGACTPFGATYFEGKLLVAVKVSGNPNLIDLDIHEVYFDADTLDLDDDGLSAADEAAAGTLDTMADSDFGGTPDGIEARVSRTDPTSSVGEPAFQLPELGTVTYVPSALIQQHLPGLSFDTLHPLSTRTAGVDGPLCMGGVCFGPSGDVVFRYPYERSTLATVQGHPAVSYDGTFIMMQTDAGLVRFWFEDGREELAVRAADFDNYVPSSEFTRGFIPIDGERTWLFSDGADHPELYPAVIALADGDTITVVYDQEKAARESGLPPGQFIDTSVGVIGWNDVTEQLHIGVYSSWETYLIGVGADGTLTNLGRSRLLSGRLGDDPLFMRGQRSNFPPPLPPYLVPTGHGDFFAAGSLMEPFGGYRNAAFKWFESMHIASSGELFFQSPRRPFGIWGDVLLAPVCCNLSEDGFYELVRYDQSVAPGDLLYLKSAGGAGGWMLEKSGPRGGLVDLWPSPLTDLVAVVGMDLARDESMRLCIADEGAGMLWELEPAGPRAAPEIIRYSAPVPGIIDCAYEPDGSLTVLAGDPSRLLVRAAGDDFGDLTPGPTIDARPDPIELVQKPDGASEVRRLDGLRGKAYLPDGRVLTMRDTDFTLLIDDVAAIGVPPLVYQNYIPGSSFPQDFPTRVSFALRPDGQIVMMQHHAEVRPPYATRGRAYVVDVAKQQISRLAVEDVGGGGNGIGLVMVPGGSAADPWTGRVGSDPILPPNVTTPPIPHAPIGGSEVAGSTTEPGGCSGSGPSPLLALSLIALALLRAAGRRHRPARDPRDA